MPDLRLAEFMQPQYGRERARSLSLLFLSANYFQAVRCYNAVSISKGGTPCFNPAF